jgi:hypothetical protein
LDKKTGTSSFSKRKMHGKGLLNHILAVYSLMRLVEEVMKARCVGSEDFPSSRSSFSRRVDREASPMITAYD